MNQGQVNFRFEPAMSENAVYGKKETESTGGCCCGDKQKINITRDKMMNETNETTNKITTTVTAPEIVCGGCANSIKKALGTVAGVSEVEVDVASKKVTVNHGESVSRETIVDALERAGYSVAS